MARRRVSVESVIMDRLDRDQQQAELLSEFPVLTRVSGLSVDWSMNNESDVMSIVFDDRY